MSLRSQSLRIASRALHASSQRGTSSVGAAAWRQQQHQFVSNCSLSARSSGMVSSNANSYFRGFSTKPEEEVNKQDGQSSEGEAAENNNASEESTDNEASAADADASSKVVADLETQIKDLKDNLLRSLAEQENTRRIAQRDVANAKNFAISSFAKSLLDTSDNLSRALDAVPEDLRHDHENHPVLANLYEGIVMTETGLTKAFEKNGLIKFGKKGEKFDPNLHEALFEYPDPEGEAGNIGQVMKVGFMLNKRVVRPAEVGVVKAP